MTSAHFGDTIGSARGLLYFPVMAATATISVAGYAFAFTREGDRVNATWSSPWRSHLQFSCAADADAILDTVGVCVDSQDARTRVLAATASVLPSLLELL